MTSTAEHIGFDPHLSGPEVSFGSWVGAVRRGVMRFQFDCDRPRSFAGRFRNRSAGGVDFIDMACGRHAAHRPAEAISPSDPGFYIMTLQLSGELTIDQDDRKARLTPGLFALYDSTRPSTITASDDYRSTCIRFPKERLSPHGTEPLADITATGFEYQPGLQATVWDTLISLNRNLSSLGTHGTLAVRSAMDLVNWMLRTELGCETTPRRDMIERIKEYVDAHLGDPDLTPARVAAALYISPRHLHNVFAGTETSAARWIRARRIEMCRRDLSDPTMRSVPAAAIGARWGFRDASHFGRVFKQETGHTPADYRTLPAAGSDSSR